MDYKAAFARVDDDSLYHTYKTQLNCYTLLAEYCGLGKVTKLALVYTQPCTGEESAKLEGNQRKDGFALGFQVVVLNVPLDVNIVSRLGEKAWEVYSQLVCPKGLAGCRNCKQLEEMIAALKLVLGDYRKIA